MLETTGSEADINWALHAQMLETTGSEAHINWALHAQILIQQGLRQISIELCTCRSWNNRVWGRYKLSFARADAGNYRFWGRYKLSFARADAGNYRFWGRYKLSFARAVAGNYRFLGRYQLALHMNQRTPVLLALCAGCQASWCTDWRWVFKMRLRHLERAWLVWCMCRVGQNHIMTVYSKVIFGREISNDTVI